MVELVRLGCGEGQGYFLSEPLPAHRVTALLAGGAWQPCTEPLVETVNIL
jgi:EAL domain-containing protein (putative c-di-GMP-specific phosphodiesterase class I)